MLCFIGRQWAAQGRAPDLALPFALLSVSRTWGLARQMGMRQEIHRAAMPRQTSWCQGMGHAGSPVTVQTHFIQATS